MSSTQDVSTYEFAFNYTDPNYQNGFGFQISEQPGFGDAEAFALESAISAALGATASLAPNSGVFKSRKVATNFDTNAEAVPPSFT